MGSKRGHGEGTAEWDEKRRCYFAKVTYKDPVSGETKRKKIKGTQNKGETIKLGQAWARSIESGLLPDASKTSLWTWLKRWLDDYVKPPRVKVKTHEKYESVLRLYVKPALGDVPITKLQAPDVQRLYNQLLQSGGEDKKGLSAHTVKCVHIALHAALKQALKAGMITRNVLDATEPPKGQRVEVKALTPEQEKNLLAAAYKEGDRAYIICLLALSTGMRRGEIFGLKWSDIDLDKSTIHVQRSIVTVGGKIIEQESTKTASSRRRIPVPAGVIKELRKWKAIQNEQRLAAGEAYSDKGLVITTEVGTPYHPSTFDKVYKRALKAAGMKDEGFCLHDLRHTHATRLFAEGWSAKAVQERLGHSSIKVTMDTYTHLVPGIQDEMVKKLDGIWTKADPTPGK